MLVLLAKLGLHLINLHEQQTEEKHLVARYLYLGNITCHREEHVDRVVDTLKTALPPGWVGFNSPRVSNIS